MNTKRILGQVLLWVGFLSAALAAVSQRERDLLAPADRLTLNLLNEELSIPEPVFDEQIEQPIEKLNNEELATMVIKVNATYAQLKKQQEEQEKENENEGNSGQEPAQADDESEEAEKRIKMIDRDEVFKRRLRLVDNKWSTIPWLWYIVSMVIGVAGVVLLRSKTSTVSLDGVEDPSKPSEQYSIVTNNLDRLTSAIGKLNADLNKLSPAEIVQFIDDQCAEPFANFADARESLIDRFGLQAYADIMTEFASAERFVNRSWSAAADGYVGEVETSIARAQAHLKNANRLMTDLETKREQ